MQSIVLLVSPLLLCSCAQDHDQNNPYALENTNIDYEAPEPY